MPSSILFVRHGEVHNPDHIVYADIPGFVLSERGRRQATEAADRLASRELVAIYSSPLERALETAAPIAAACGLDVDTVEELTEWGLSLRWKGMRWEELDDLLPGELSAYLEHPWDLPFSPESLEDLALRMTAAVTDLAAAHDGPIAVVSHQDPIQAARLALTHRTLQGLNDDKPGHAEVFELIPGDPWTELDRWTPSDQEAFPPS